MSFTRPSAEKPPVTIPPARPPREAWIITAALVLFMMLNFADKAVLGLAAKPIMDELLISPSQYGLVSSGFFFVFCISAVLVGFLANRVRTKWLLLVMALLWSVTQLPILLSASFGALLMSRIALGAAEGPAYPVATHALHKWFSDKDRSLATSLLTVGAPLGVIVASPVLTWLIVDYGWRAAFAALAIVGVLWAIMWAKIGKEGPETKEYKATPAEPVKAPGQYDGGPRPEGIVKVPFWRILMTGTWLASLLGGFAVYWALSVLTAWVPLYLQDALGYSATAAGSLVVLPWAIYGIAQVTQGFVTRSMLGRGWSSRVARGVLGGACVFLAGAAMLLLVIAPAGPLQIVLLSLAFGLGAPIFPIAQTTSAEIAPSSQRAGVLGTYAALYSLAAVIAPYLVGVIVQDSPTPSSGYNAAFIITGVLLILSGLVAAIFIRPQRDATRIRLLAGTGVQL